MSAEQSISAIIATVGRPELLRVCLRSLSKQTVHVREVIVVHCGDDSATYETVADPCWREAGMEVRYFHYPERNCARQRNFAIQKARHQNLLLVDDDIELEPTWAHELFGPMWEDPTVAATMGRLVNQPMSSPTFLWSMYRVLLHGKAVGFRPGLLIGAALPNGFPLTAKEPIACEWIGGGASALKREAFEAVGGFASFFAGSSPGEDLDLGYRLSREWKVFYVPTAKCFHHQASAGREDAFRHQFLSMRSRFGILRVTMKRNRASALLHIALWATVQCASELASLRRGSIRSDLTGAWFGRLRGFLSCLYWSPETATSG